MDGLKKLTVCPKNVASPCDDPTGRWMPPGNGSESVAAGERKFYGTTMVVVWLKPS